MINRRIPNNIEAQYFEWLYSHIGAVQDRNPNHSHWLLAEILFQEPFIWSVNHDGNRAEDGKVLRDEFCDLVSSWGRSRFPFTQCTVLEMLIALSKRAQFEAYGLDIVGDTSGDWFWHLMDNLGMTAYTDEAYSQGLWAPQDVSDILDRVLLRTYSYNGSGGLFPLDKTQTDQTTQELWFQMSEYILEKSGLCA